MKFSAILAAVVASVALAAAAVPASAEPSLSLGDDTCPVVGSATQGCNLYISFFDGRIEEDPGASATSYDGVIGDTLIGVINNTSNPISSFNVTSNGDIFDFTVNGIDGYASDGVTPTGDNSDTTGYGGPDAYFTAISGSTSDEPETGTINFANGGLQPGATDYFALVGPVDFSESPTVNPYVPDPLLPEPGTLTILSVGLLASGVARRFRRKA
ncbi:MAG TPA: PEP-CTERM sorting domain-containing protein [Rhodopila sp.]